MASSAVITVRLEPELLAALKAKVRREGTTVSAEIVRLLTAELRSKRPALGRPTMGMFAGQFEDLELADFKQLRREFSARLLGSVRTSRGSRAAEARRTRR